MKDQLLKCLDKARKAEASSFFNFKDNEVGKIAFHCYKNTPLRGANICFYLEFEKARLKIQNEEEDGIDFNEPGKIEALISVAEQYKNKILFEDKQLLEMGFHRVWNSFYKYMIQFPINGKDKFIIIKLEKLNYTKDYLGSWKMGRFDMGLFKTVDYFDALKKILIRMDFIMKDCFIQLPSGLRDWISKGGRHE